MIFVLAQIAWVGGTALILFFGIKYTLGLRINNEIEEVCQAEKSLVCDGHTARPG